MPTLKSSLVCRNVYPSESDPALLECDGVGENIKARYSERDGRFFADFWIAIVIAKSDADVEGVEHVLTLWGEGPGDSLSRPLQSRFTFEGDDHYFVQQFTVPVPAGKSPVTLNFRTTLDNQGLTDLPVTVEVPQGE